MDYKEKLLTFKEFCELCSITKAKGRTIVARRELPVYKIGRLLRFQLRDIANWLELSRQNSVVSDE